MVSPGDVRPHSIWNQISIGLLSAAAGSASFTRVAKFFERLLCGLVSLRMARSHRQAPEPELSENPSDMALRDTDTEPRLDLGLKIDAAPAHDAVHGDIGALFDQPRKFGQLRGVQSRTPPRPRPVAQAIHSRLVVGITQSRRV